jgi:hypothetical protein
MDQPADLIIEIFDDFRSGSFLGDQSPSFDPHSFELKLKSILIFEF